MPHHKSCYKRMKQSAKSRERNSAYRSTMKSYIKRVENAENPETARTEYQKASSVLDKLVTKGIIHRNKANNKKSRLARLINRMESSAEPTA